MRRTTRSLLTAAIAVAVLGVTACGGASDGDSPAARSIDTSNGLVIDGETIADQALWEQAEGGRVSLATALTEREEKVITEQFTADTGIALDFVRLPTPKLFERAVSEKGAGKLSFDVIRVTDTTAAEEMAKNGVFGQTRTPFDDQLREDGALDVGGGNFVSAFYAIYTFAYNSQAVPQADAPKTWEDLLAPAYQGKIGLVNPNGSGYNTALTDMLIQDHGDRYLQDLQALGPRIFDSVSVMGTALGQGELTVGLMGANSAMSLAEQGAPVVAVIPPDGVSAGYTPFGITITGAENPAAQVFVNWQMSRAGQSKLGPLGLAPARSDVEPARMGDAVLPKPGDANFTLFTSEDRQQRQAAVLATWNGIFRYTG